MNNPANPGMSCAASVLVSSTQALSSNGHVVHSSPSREISLSRMESDWPGMDYKPTLKPIIEVMVMEYANLP